MPINPGDAFEGFGRIILGGLSRLGMNVLPEHSRGEALSPPPSEGDALKAAIKKGEAGDVSRLVARAAAERIRPAILSTRSVDRVLEANSAVAGTFGGGKKKV